MKKFANFKKFSQFRVLLFLLILLFLLSGVLSAQAQEGIPSISKNSACLVCHADKNLVKITPEGKKSLYTNPTLYNQSVHKETTCVACHLSFIIFVRPPAFDYKKEANFACKERDCHPDSLTKYSLSIHGKGGATCSDCHGTHGMQKVKSKVYRATSQEACSRKECHQNFWENYDDHYHGRAYKLKEPDAPPCWDCHGAHNILPSKEPDSPVSEANIARTCGKCHKELGKADQTYLQYTTLIHERERIERENPLMNFFSQVIEYLKRLFSNLFGK